MNLRNINLPLTMLGLFLIISPVAVYGLIRMATVIYDITPPSLTSPYPAGSSTSPTPLTPGATIYVKIHATDAGTFLNKPVTCKITTVEGTSYSKTLSLSPYVPRGDYQGHRTTWTVPSYTGVKYKFVFSASDGAGNTATKTTYGVVGKPDGTFYINGKSAGPSTKIYVKTATLNFKFVASRFGSMITRVRVVVKRSGLLLKDFNLEETTTNQEWTGSYTLPGEGTYTITGSIFDKSGEYIKLSIVAAWGEDNGIDPLKAICIVSVITGTVLLALGLAGRRIR